MLIAQGVKVPAGTPFRKYAELVGEIAITPTLAELKRALDAGTAQTKYPIGTEIPDTWNGESNPLIVAQYSDILVPSGYRKFGAYLVRKYASLPLRPFGSASYYHNSLIAEYLNNEYFEKCSDEAKQVVSSSRVAADEMMNAKFFLMSTKEYCYGYGAGRFEYYKQQSPSGNMVAKSLDGKAQTIWLRDHVGSNVVVVLWNGNTDYHSPRNEYAVLVACAVVAD